MSQRPSPLIWVKTAQVCSERLHLGCLQESSKIFNQAVCWIPWGRKINHVWILPSYEAGMWLGHDQYFSVLPLWQNTVPLQFKFIFKPCKVLSACTCLNNQISFKILQYQGSFSLSGLYIIKLLFKSTKSLISFCYAAFPIVQWSNSCIGSNTRKCCSTLEKFTRPKDSWRG